MDRPEPTTPAQIAVASSILAEYGLSTGEIQALFNHAAAGILMRLNTRGGGIEQHYQRVLRDRRSSLVEVACFLFSLRMPPNRNMPKALIRRRVHCHYTLEKYLPIFVEQCKERFPEDTGFYNWAANEIRRTCRTYLEATPDQEGG